MYGEVAKEQEWPKITSRVVTKTTKSLQVLVKLENRIVSYKE